MSELLDRLIAQACELSLEEKSLLAESLPQSVTLPDSEWEAAWIDECHRRLQLPQSSEER